MRLLSLSRCPVQRGSYPWSRLIHPHLEDASSGLDLITGTPSSDEGSCEGRIAEIDLQPTDFDPWGRRDRLCDRHRPSPV
jgi:hypothetical protein